MSPNGVTHCNELYFLESWITWARLITCCTLNSVLELTFTISDQDYDGKFLAADRRLMVYFLLCVVLLPHIGIYKTSLGYPHVPCVFS